MTKRLGKLTDKSRTKSEKNSTKNNATTRFCTYNTQNTNITTIVSDDEDDIEITVVPNTFAIEGRSVVITLDDDEDIEKLCKEITNTRYAKKIGLKRAGERILGWVWVWVWVY